MGEINWRDNWDSALEEAKKENRRILLELYMDGCPHCTHLHTETHVDPGVIRGGKLQVHPGAPGRAQEHGYREKIQRHRGAHHPGLRGRRQGTATVSRLLPAGGLLETTGEIRLIARLRLKGRFHLEGSVLRPEPGGVRRRPYRTPSRPQRYPTPSPINSSCWRFSGPFPAILICQGRNFFIV